MFQLPRRTSHTAIMPSWLSFAVWSKRRSSKKSINCRHHKPIDSQLKFHSIFFRQKLSKISSNYNPISSHMLLQPTHRHTSLDPLRTLSVLNKSLNIFPVFFHWKKTVSVRFQITVRPLKLRRKSVFYKELWIIRKREKKDRDKQLSRKTQPLRLFLVCLSSFPETVKIFQIKKEVAERWEHTTLIKIMKL